MTMDLGLLGNLRGLAVGGMHDGRHFKMTILFLTLLHNLDVYLKIYNFELKL